jgi:serine/threonine protein phosphatase PrpC
MNWKVFEGVATGTSHLERMTACQDACRTWTGGDGFLVAVVCDGAGSASLSEIGSRICSDAVVERIASCLNAELEEGGTPFSWSRTSSKRRSITLGSED